MATLRLHRHGAPPLEVTQDRVLVGRDPSCDLVIDDKSVSRRHAYFERRGPGWGIIDQGSANGTFVNGAQVTDALLYDGQELRLGMVPMRVEIESAMAGTVLMDSPVQGTVLMPAGGMQPMPSAAPAPPASAPGGWGAQPAYAPAPQPAYAPAPPPAYAPPPQQYGQPAYAQPQPAYTPTPQDEAALMLNVRAQATPEEVKARYTEMAADLETKLANARTPHLKTTYQRNLDELQKAAELLAPGATMEVDNLPVSAPVVVPDELDMSIPAPVRAAMAEKPIEAAEPKAGLPPTSAVTIGFITMGMIAMAAYFNLSAGKQVKALTKKLSDPHITQARQDAIKYKEIENLAAANVLANSKLKLCNKGTQPYEVVWLGAVYATTSPDTGKTFLRSFNSGFCADDFKVTVSPGAEQAVEVRGKTDACKWDGQTLFYAAAFKDPRDPEKQIRISGPLHNRTDCVNIGEGW